MGRPASVYAPASGWDWSGVKSGGASGLHPTLPTPASKLAGDPVRKGAKDGAPELLRLVKGGPPAKYGDSSLRSE